MPAETLGEMDSEFIGIRKLLRLAVIAGCRDISIDPDDRNHGTRAGRETGDKRRRESSGDQRRWEIRCGPGKHVLQSVVSQISSELNVQNTVGAEGVGFVQAHVP